MELIIALSSFVVVAVVFFWLLYDHNKKFKRKDRSGKFPSGWKKILNEKVKFYQSLSDPEKRSFESRMLDFLDNIKISGVKTEVNSEDKVLLAASAIIPIFAFPKWRYSEIDEILLYPNEFNQSFDINGNDRNISGMVGSGFMNGKMIISKAALHHGFANETDKKNTAIHEFIHILDKEDGHVDGIPSLLLKRQYSLPWMDLIQKKIEEIMAKKKSDINPYGATGKAEFFAVLGEYFFERPKLLKRKHPKLYGLLEKVFNQDMAAKLKSRKDKKNISRNDPCPCGSGKKYKNCCGA